MREIGNFTAGPSALPNEVKRRLKEQMFDFLAPEVSIMEISHRSSDYEEVHQKAKGLIKSLLKVPDSYDVLFLQGGASLQFAMIPLNFLLKDQVANYLVTGTWSEKALKEANQVGNTRVGASNKEGNYRQIPKDSDVQTFADDAYVHITSNNTIYGTQWQQFPKVKNLVADMSSDILSRRLNVADFSLIYAGAQKNLGPSGVTIVIMKKELLEQGNPTIPKMLQYKTHADKDSLYNTPPTFAIYVLSQVLQWVDEQGGVGSMEQLAQEKSSLLYTVIDQSNGFYQGHATKDSRSKMNVTFTLPSQELTEKFLAEAKQRGFIGLNGHRSVGGCRASIYNGVPLKACEDLANYMEEFVRDNR